MIRVRSPDAIPTAIAQGTCTDAVSVCMNALRLLHMVARRGNARDFPENSLAALRSAIELGARFIEIDVHLSSDGMPMVVHDRQLTRIANFEELPPAQLPQLGAGQPERFGERT